MPPKCKFQEGEKVLCFHGPLIYEAKCLKSSFSKEDKQIKYYIHYAGWSKNWDEWVPEDRVLKYNDFNVQKQKEVQKVHDHQIINKPRKSSGSLKVHGRKSEGSRDKERESNSRASTPVAILERTPSRASKSGSALTPTSSSDSPLEAPRKKRGRPEPSDDTEEYSVKSEIKISIPNGLKCHLIDERDVITKQKKLPSLPMSVTVDKILNDYVEAVNSGKVNGLNKESAVEVSKGIKEYFNVSINLRLLYAWEKPQFEEMVPEDSEISPSSLYGPYHLLRLFVKLGEMLSYTSLDDKSIQLLLTHFDHFLQYLQSNSASLFNLQDYKDPLPEYDKKMAKYVSNNTENTS
ncbi:mortality factor 4-like protein 1 [Copidosoma floridanum]|uniref:mortality factor 4-like protein 1 n=1 Tax=Copidosoma floridanum TaxID=29053 RepID=UPI0006C9E4ED|nr:mortality factor 4-like protein 1 [Copidosoma floridanum]XP_023244903.1 mortality factor 4-like protein 1 [Copidosoma floridanum]